MGSYAAIPYSLSLWVLNPSLSEGRGIQDPIPYTSLEVRWKEQILIHRKALRPFVGLGGGANLTKRCQYLKPEFHVNKKFVFFFSTIGDFLKNILPGYQDKIILPSFTFIW